jgi:hypothetical protein
VTAPETLDNPFPGLRPFEADEAHLFFGRERETDELLRRLRYNRFLSVIGTSGCGKSSLVRCGLVPSLHSGLMARAGSSWRIAILRPGEDPIGHLADALDTPDVLGPTDADLGPTTRMLLEVSLRRGTLGLVDAVRHARIPPGDNVLVLVDQFEELFRFQRNRRIEHARADAIHFVQLLLEAANQTQVPIYVAITMRSDYIGDCMDYPGLPEALNACQYLVPRLTRDELRSAITGPVAVAGAAIAPRLVQRLLNDLGNDQDQLPVLQHALMRTWDNWERHHVPGEPIDIPHYEAVGTLRDALSRHAEEAFDETGSDRHRRTAERVFKALTDTVTDPRGVRHPCTVAELTAIAEVPEAEVIEVLDAFRQSGRSFLMPPASVPLEAHVIVDLSHESLMRCWTRLIRWAEEERTSAAQYLRLTTAARWFEEGSAGLWRNPELELGLCWRQQNRPTAAWARRYDESFDRAMQFLDRSEQERTRERDERAAARRRQWRQLQLTAIGLAALLVYAIWNARAASHARELAEQNLQDARRAVDASLALIDRSPAGLGIDHPEIIAFRRDLAGRAQEFYAEFIKRDPDSEELQRSIAAAHFRLGKINLILDDPAAASQDFQRAIEGFERLAGEHPGTADYRQALANAVNWLGETIRPAGDKADEARKAYDRALDLQDELRRQDPGRVDYQRELARTYSNRGILHASASDTASSKLAESDFREAIRLLEPLATDSADPGVSQELARVFNNLGNLLTSAATGEARPLQERAVAIHEALSGRYPENREYRVELAQFHTNLADTFREDGYTDLALRHSGRALTLLRALARPAPSLAIDEADAHNLRGWILEERDWRQAIEEYRTALEQYRRLVDDDLAWRLQPLHRRFGDLLHNLTYLSARPASPADARLLLDDALSTYLAIASQVVAAGSRSEAGYAHDTVSRLVPELPASVNREVAGQYRNLETRLREMVEAR